MFKPKMTKPLKAFADKGLIFVLVVLPGIEPGSKV